MRGAKPAPRGVRVLSRRHMHRFPRTGAPDVSLLTKTNILQQLYFTNSLFDLCARRTRSALIESRQLFIRFAMTVSTRPNTPSGIRRGAALAPCNRNPIPPIRRSYPHPSFQDDPPMADP